MRKLHGHLWFIRRYGLRRYVRYERARRAGVMVDYSSIFTPNELAILEEHFLGMYGGPR